MDRNGLIQANLSVLLAIVVLLAFAEDIVGDFAFPREREWLNSTRLVVGLIFALCAGSLFPTMASYYLPGSKSTRLLKFAQFVLITEFFVLFAILTRFMYAAIYGVS